MAQRITRLTTDQKIGGSNPLGIDTVLFYILFDRCFNEIFHSSWVHWVSNIFWHSWLAVEALFFKPRVLKQLGSLLNNTRNMIHMFAPLGFSHCWEFFIFAQINTADVLKVFRTVLYIFWNFHKWRSLDILLYFFALIFHIT